MATVFRSSVFRSLFSGTPLSRSPVLIARPCFSTLTSSQEDDGPTVDVPYWLDVKATTEALYFYVDMPGLREEHVKAYMLGGENCVLIKGQKEKEPDENKARKYSYRLTLKENCFKPEEMEAQMEDGVLLMAIPRIEKKEEKTEVV